MHLPVKQKKTHVLETQGFHFDFFFNYMAKKIPKDGDLLITSFSLFIWLATEVCFIASFAV